MWYDIWVILRKGGDIAMPDAPSKRRWDAENTIVFSIKLMKRTEEDIVKYLDDCVSRGISKGAIIKAALREYMKNHPN